MKKQYLFFITLFFLVFTLSIFPLIQAPIQSKVLTFTLSIFPLIQAPIQSKVLTSIEVSPDIKFLANDTYEDYNYDLLIKENVYIRSLRNVQCSWHKDNYKTCSVIAELRQPSEVKLDSKTIKDVLKTKGLPIKDDDVKYEVSDSYSLKSKEVPIKWEILNESNETKELFKNKTEPKVLETYLTVSRDWSRFEALSMKTISKDTWNAVKMTFDVPKYFSGKFDIIYSFEGKDYVLDPDIDACGILGTPNTIYTLNQSVSSTGTCFTVTAQNVTIDCNGYGINFSSATQGYGVASNSTNTTVKNCAFINNTNASNVESYPFGVFQGVTVNAVNSSFNKSKAASLGSELPDYGANWNGVNMTGNVLLYHLNEASGTIVDYSGRNLNGTMEEGASYNASGILNTTATSYDGANDDIAAGAISSRGLNTSSNFTVSLWTKNVASQPAGYEFPISLGSDVLIVGSYLNKFYASRVNYNQENCAVIADGVDFSTWHNFVFTRNSGSSVGYVSMYVDGVNVTRMSPGACWSTDTNDRIFIGENGANLNTYNWEGVIDEVAIWNRTLSDAEVAHVYEVQKAAHNASNDALNVSWYADTFVNDTAGNNVSGANVSVYNVTGSLINTSLTGSNGLTPRLTLREYMQNATAKYFDTNYTFHGNKSDYINDTQQVNLTDNRLSGVNPIVLTLEAGAGDTTNPIATFGANPIDNYNDTDGSIIFEGLCTDEINVSTFQIWTNMTGSWASNYSNTSYINNTWMNITINGITRGTYKWGIKCIDNSSNVGWSTNRTFYYPDNKPFWSSWWQSIVSIYDSVTNSLFGIRWQDDVNVSYVYWESNFSGSPFNYTMPLTSGNFTDGMYNKSIILPAGTFYWRTWANDSLNQWNVTNITIFTIAKSSDSCGVYFNTTSPVTYPNTFRVWTNCTSSYNLTRNGTSISNNSIQDNGVGYFNFTVQRTDIENYSTNFDQKFFTINQATPSLVLSSNVTWSATYPTTSNISGSVCQSSLTCLLYRNGTQLAGSSDTQTFGVGFYAYVYNTTGNVNYTSGTTNNNLTITKSTSICGVFFNATSPLTYPTTFTANTNCSSAYTLKLNGTTISNNSVVNSGAGYYNISVFRTDTENYSNTFDQKFMTVNQHTGALTFKVNDITTDLSITYPTQVNASAYSSSGQTILITRNSTDVTTENNIFVSLASDYYDYIGVAQENQNYSYLGKGIYLTLNQNTSVCGVYFNATSPQPYLVPFIVYTNCSSSYVLTRNGTGISNASTQSLSEGYYNFSVQRTDIENYSNNFDQQFMTIGSAPDTTNPTPVLGTNPINYFNSTSSSVFFEFKCFDDVAVSSIAIYGNWSGWSQKYINISYINNTDLNKTLNAIPNGEHLWGLKCVDTTGNVGWSSNRTLTINYTSPPSSSNVTSVALCTYKKFGYYNLNLVWYREEGCL